MRPNGNLTSNLPVVVKITVLKPMYNWFKYETVYRNMIETTTNHLCRIKDVRCAYGNYNTIIIKLESGCTITDTSKLVSFIASKVHNSLNEWLMNSGSEIKDILLLSDGYSMDELSEHTDGILFNLKREVNHCEVLIEPFNIHEKDLELYFKSMRNSLTNKNLNRISVAYKQVGRDTSGLTDSFNNSKLFRELVGGYIFYKPGSFHIEKKELDFEGDMTV